MVLGHLSLIINNDNVLLEHSGLPHVLPLAVPIGHSKSLLLFEFLNLPLWANFYNYPDLSCSTTTLDQPTLLDDLNLNPQPG